MPYISKMHCQRQLLGYQKPLGNLWCVKSTNSQGPTFQYCPFTEAIPMCAAPLTSSIITFLSYNTSETVWKGRKFTIESVAVFFQPRPCIYKYLSVFCLDGWGETQNSVSGLLLTKRKISDWFSYCAKLQPSHFRMKSLNEPHACYKCKV